MAVCVPADRSLPSTARVVRVLRWSFRRRDEYVSCELGLDQHDSAYELTLTMPWSIDPSTEVFNDAISALQRQASIERLLIDEGWSLETFETDRALR